MDWSNWFRLDVPFSLAYYSSIRRSPRVAMNSRNREKSTTRPATAGQLQAAAARSVRVFYESTNTVPRCIDLVFPLTYAINQNRVTLLLSKWIFQPNNMNQNAYEIISTTNHSLFFSKRFPIFNNSPSFWLMNDDDWHWLAEQRHVAIIALLCCTGFLADLKGET